MHWCSPSLATRITSALDIQEGQSAAPPLESSLRRVYMTRNDDERSGCSTPALPDVCVALASVNCSSHFVHGGVAAFPLRKA